jgi:predicted transposase/invertase (TIGR01784 family)
MKFNDLGSAIAINILDFNYLPHEEYHNVYRLRNIAKNDELTDVLELNFIELPKIPHNLSESPKDLWMKFLSAEDEEVLKMIAKQNKTMDKAVKKLVYVSADELIRYEMDMREKIELDYHSAMRGSYDEGREEGKKEGREEGKQQKVREMVYGMKNDGLSEEAIARIAKLTIEEIQSILANKQ